MSKFDSVTLAPPDPILSLTGAFKADPNPEKINLSVGVFVNDHGVTPILETVRSAEKRLAETGKTKSYLPIMGTPQYASLTQQLCFGEASATPNPVRPTPSLRDADSRTVFLGGAFENVGTGAARHERVCVGPDSSA